MSRNQDTMHFLSPSCPPCLSLAGCAEDGGGADDELVFLDLLPFWSKSRVYLLWRCFRWASRDSWMYSLCLVLSSFFLCASLSTSTFEVSASTRKRGGGGYNTCTITLMSPWHRLHRVGLLWVRYTHIRQVLAGISTFQEVEEEGKAEERRSGTAATNSCQPPVKKINVCVTPLQLLKSLVAWNTAGFSMH